jgi:tRNA G10  N-methylase Trm11
VIPSNPEYDYSIDAIVTDPPYGKKYLDLYDQLARHAIRILKALLDNFLTTKMR